jgi:hypothetical protein
MSLSRQRPTSQLTMAGPCAWCEKEASLFEQTLRNNVLINTGVRRTREDIAHHFASPPVSGPLELFPVVDVRTSIVQRMSFGSAISAILLARLIKLKLTMRL